GCRRINPLAIEVEGLEQPRLVEGHVGLDPLQGAFADEKWRFQSTVVARKSHGMDGVIVEAAFVGKAQRHDRTTLSPPSTDDKQTRETSGALPRAGMSDRPDFHRDSASRALTRSRSSRLEFGYTPRAADNRDRYRESAVGGNKAGCSTSESVHK